MKQVVQSYKTGEVTLREVPTPQCGSKRILVKNRHSLVSIGTERMTIELGRKSLLGKAKARPDLVRRVWEKSKQEGSRNYPGIDSQVVDFLIENLIGAKSRKELTTIMHALDRVLLWGHYVIPMHHSGIDRIAYWNFLEYPAEVPLYGIVIETWWVNKKRAKELNKL